MIIDRAEVRYNVMQYVQQLLEAVRTNAVELPPLPTDIHKQWYDSTSDSEQPYKYLIKYATLLGAGILPDQDTSVFDTNDTDSDSDSDSEPIVTTITTTTTIVS